MSAISGKLSIVERALRAAHRRRGKNLAGWLAMTAIAIPMGGSSVLCQDGAPTGAITGVVTDLLGRGLSRAQLSLYLLSPGLDQWKADRTMRQVSDDEGNYLIEGIPPGTYMVRAWVEGFVPSRVWEVHVLSGERRSVDLALPAGNPGDAPRVRHILSGRVHNTDGHPLAGVRLSFRDAFNGGIRLQSRTDGNGRFSMDVFHCGIYIISAFKPGFELEVRVVRWCGGQPDVLDFTLEMASDQQS